MKSSSEAVTIVWKVLNESALKTAITGKIYKGTRPLNSNLEDIVINSLAITNEQMQEGVLNVNVYVPNLILNSSAGVDDSLPNYARLTILSGLAITALNEQLGFDWQFRVQQENVFQDEGLHYSNIRVEFYSINA